MPLYTRKQFAELCDVTVNYLNVYIGRNKVILSGEYIDDSIPQNGYFLQKCLDKQQGIGKSIKKEKKMANTSNVSIRPELELNIDWETEIRFNQNYNHEAEKNVCEIMIKHKAEDQEFTFVPLVMANAYVAEYLIGAYEFMLKREIHLLEEMELKVTPKQVTALIEYYRMKCVSEIQSCCKNLKNGIEEIIEEHISNDKNTS